MLSSKSLLYQTSKPTQLSNRRCENLSKERRTEPSLRKKLFERIVRIAYYGSLDDSSRRREKHNLLLFERKGRDTDTDTDSKKKNKLKGQEMTPNKKTRRHAK